MEHAIAWLAVRKEKCMKRQYLIHLYLDDCMLKGRTVGLSFPEARLNVKQYSCLIMNKSR